MRTLLLLGILVWSLTGFEVMAQSNVALRFGEDGKFKIAQFTYLHWDSKSSNSSVTMATIKEVLRTEKPDLAILTGDVVSDIPADEGWHSIIEIFEKERIPFAVTMGNHDAEQGYSRNTIFNWLSKSTYFVGNRGPEDIHGCGNFIIEIQKASELGLAALLYCLDSNDYPQNARKYGAYDNIKYDQIEWYRKQSEQYTKNNGNKPIPSLAFFHIPIPEYNSIVGKHTTIGHYGETISSPNINSSLFSSIIDMGDVMGCFVGHDHNNDLIGINYDIALGFGRTTGANARGDLERGGRIIELYEGQRKFDTWIRTAHGTELYYYYPSGISSVDEKELKYLPSVNIKPIRQGINYIYYEGQYESTADFSPVTEKKRGTVSNFTIKGATVKDYFGYEFQTWIKIPKRGVYHFYTYSDDGSKLLIDDNVVVDNDGSHSAEYVSGKIALEAGFHKLILRYFESYMGEELEVGIASREILEMRIPSNMLFIQE